MSQVLAAIPFIAEFKLACDGGEVRIFLILVKREQKGVIYLSICVTLLFLQTPALYADIDGVLMPVTKSAEGEKYQVQSKLSFVFTKEHNCETKLLSFSNTSRFPGPKR